MNRRRREVRKLATSIGIAAIACGVVLQALAGHGPVAQDKQSPEVLLAAALQLEEVDGRLDDAIAAYRKVLAAPGVTNAQAARAQLHVGACYERMGNEEARKAYDAVLKYTDQPELVAQARARLAALGGGAAKPSNGQLVARLVWEDRGVYALGAVVSPDGRYLAYDGPEGLTVRSVATGETQRLTDFDWGYDVVWAPDGRRLAYAWYPPGGSSELRVVGLDGSEPRAAFSSPDVRLDAPLDWSPDGESIVASIRSADFTGLATFSAAGKGMVKKIHPLVRGELISHVRFSPDGRHVAFSVTTRGKPSNIVVSALDGSGEHTISGANVSDDLVGWIPGGNGLLFLSDRGGSRGLWMGGVNDGGETGAPRLLKAGLDDAYVGPFSTLEVTPNGSVFYAVRVSTKAVMLAELDVESGRVVAVPEPLLRQSQTDAAAWSPDGRLVAVRPGNVTTGGSLSILDFRSRNLLNLSLPAPLSAYPVRWTPDGSAIIAETRRSNETEQAVSTIDAATGEIKELVPLTNWSRAGAVLSGDGRRLFYTALDPGGGAGKLVSTVVARDLGTGAEQEIYRGDPGALNGLPQLSADHRSLAFRVSSSLPGTRTGALMVVSPAGGQVREVYRTPTGSNIGGFAWMPDGRSFVVSVRKSGKDGTSSSVWIVPLDGGQPRETALKGANIIFLSMHPDGRHLLYSDSTVGPSQLWALENVLPASVR